MSSSIEPVLLFDHPQERAQRLERAIAIGRIRRASSSTRNDAPWTCSVSSGARSSRPALRQSQRARHQRVVEHALLAHPLDDRRRAPRAASGPRTRVDVVGRLRERARRRSGSVGLDHLVRDRGRPSRRRSRARAGLRACTKSMCRSRTDGAAGASAKPMWCDARESSCDAFSSRSPTVPARRSRASIVGQRRAAACATRAARRRRGGSRSRSARGPPRCAADGRGPVPRAAPGCCARSPTTARARCARPARPTTPARPARCTPRRGGARIRRCRSVRSVLIATNWPLAVSRREC